MPLEIVLKHLSLNELYRLSWGAKNAHGEEWEKLKAEFEERLEKMTKEALRYKWLKPQGVYGLFPCQSDGDELIIYDPATIDTASPDELTASTSRANPMTIILLYPITLQLSTQARWMLSHFKL